MTSSTPHSSPRPVAARRTGLRRRITAAAASLLLAAAGVVIAAGPASAHDQLISTSPADGSTVASLPAQVTLTFGELVLDTDGGTQVKATDSTGKTIDSGPTKVQDNVVTQKLAAGATGHITVLWRVISEDGHPVSGEFSFTVQGTGSSVAPVVSSPTPSPAPAAASSSSPVLWVIGGIVVVVVVIIVIAVIVSRRRPAETESSDDQES